jgi:lipoyl(octanoyl) transferase
MHGFALNVSVDLQAFALIVPCGIRDHGVTSIEALTGRAPSVRDVAFSAAAHFARTLGQAVTDVEDLSRETDLEGCLTDRASRTARS